MKMNDDPTPPRSIRVLTTLLLVGTFAFGGVTGVALTLWTRSDLRGPPPGPPPFGPLPLHELSLSPEQSQRALAIFERHRPALDAIRQEGFPKVRKINEQLESEVRELLTPEQLTRLDGLKAQRPVRMPLPPPPPFRDATRVFMAPPGAPPPEGWPPGPPPGPPGSWQSPCSPGVLPIAPPASAPAAPHSPEPAPTVSAPPAAPPAAPKR